ncbi:T9SS type A sorting domain-containing protein [Flavobacterium sp.]|uniref:T9SS type A sorting domain-containing protein n=1 Tax=Flavobacterium sp. TaxID=239 RepID=UPI0037531682
MKSKITIIIFSFCYIVGFSQDKTYDLLINKTQTNILYDRVFAVSNATNLKTENISSNYFLQVYHEMQRADFLNRLPKLETIQDEGTIGFANKQIPLSILISDFESVKKEAIENNDVILNTNNQLELISDASTVFEKHNINLIAPLLSKSKTSSVTFILKDNLIFNTTNKIISSVSYHTENDENWNQINYNQTFTILFSKAGKQIITCKIEFTTGKSKIISFEITTDNQIIGATNKNINAFAPNVVNTISSTIPYQGYGETAAFLGQGEYEIFMDTTDGILDKPIFLLDGFDPGDTRNTTAIYSLLNYGTSGENLGNLVRAQGYDVIVLNFPNYTRPSTTTLIDGGVDYIQRNAMILVQLINQINAVKIGTAQNVVIGPSMGGLISRYALRYMETNSMNPDTRLYISFDSPHLGANVPIGFQHLFNYMAFGPLGDVSVQALVNGMLKSPASREMLIDHFEGHLQTGNATEFNTASATLIPTGCPNYRTAFQNELNTMGFPTSTRNVSISNGAGNGSMTGTPDMVVMNHTFNVTSSQRAIINLRFTPLANLTNQVSRFRGQQWVIFWFTAYESMANSKSPTYTNGLDSAPGGKFDMNTLAASAGSNALLLEFFTNLQIMYFDFIPTLSSMAVSSSTNLYSNVNASSTTPFAAYSIPTANENHVTLTPTNVAFALSEILNPTLQNQDNTALNSVWIKNPIENSIQINTSYSIENAKISITDILGKTIFTVNNQTVNGTLEIPVSLSNGVYLITIGNEIGSVTKKIIKG